MSMRDADGASQDLKRLLQREADNPDVLYRLTQTLYMGSHADEAIPLLEKIVAQKGPYQIEASNDLAYLLAEKQPARLDEAAKIAAGAFKDSPRTLALLDTLGWIEHLQHNDAKAIEHLRQAIPGLRAVPEAHYHLGAVYQALGNQEWARLHLEQAATGPADKPEVAKAKALLAKRAD
jgi:cellulose synthase operon protein C